MAAGTHYIKKWIKGAAKPQVVFVFVFKRGVTSTL